MIDARPLAGAVQPSGTVARGRREQLSLVRALNVERVCDDCCVLVSLDDLDVREGEVGYLEVFDNLHGLRLVVYAREGNVREVIREKRGEGVGVLALDGVPSL